LPESFFPTQNHSHLSLHQYYLKLETSQSEAHPGSVSILYYLRLRFVWTTFKSHLDLIFSLTLSLSRPRSVWPGSKVIFDFILTLVSYQFCSNFTWASSVIIFSPWT
jgi:hypothetical protein